jgi:IMP dehydrogenase
MSGMSTVLGQSLCFDDVLLEPLLSNIVSRSSISLDVNVGTNSRVLMLKTPLISSPMDTVTEKDMAIKMALNGGIGIIHRYMSVEDQVSQVKQVKRFLQYIITNPYTVNIDSTYEDIITAYEKYNVSALCVIDNDDKLVGLFTKRDFEYMKHMIIERNTTNSQTSSNSIEPYITKKLVTMKYDCEIFVNLIDTILNDTKLMMLENKIEKIPIVYSNGKLRGLITLKNIRHYENNKYKACVNKNGALCVGAAIGIVDDYMERLDKLVAEDVDLICIDVANGFNTNVITTIQEIRAKYPNLVIMAGNVCNWQGFAALNEVDVDCIRVGVGNGSICTTRLETGIGKGQFSAVSECYNYLVKNPLLKYRANVICDGGSLGKTGNKVKALACGSSAVMLGRTLSATEESPGQIIFRNGRRFKYIRGMASTMANLSKQEKTVNGKKLNTKFTAEGVDGEQELSGSVTDVIEQINGGLKSGLSYIGCENIDQVHEKIAKGEITFNIVTSIGMSETGIRVKTY